MTPPPIPTPTSQNIILLPATTTDIPTLASVSHTSFQADTHTAFKAHFSNYHHGASMTPALESWVSRSPGKGPVIKAIDTESGEIVGWAAWSFVGFEYREEDTLSGTVPKEMGKEEQKMKDEEFERTETYPPPQLPAQTPGQSNPQYLSLLTSHTMTHYSTLLTPPNQKTAILITINILPSHQGHEIGSRLTKWGTQIADKYKATAWVSSSHTGHRVFDKCGFREVGRLEVCLDDFVDGEGNAEQEGEKKGKKEGEGKVWGEYVWRYLKRGVGGV